VTGMTLGVPFFTRPAAGRLCAWLERDRSSIPTREGSRIRQAYDRFRSRFSAILGRRARNAATKPNIGEAAGVQCTRGGTLDALGVIR